MASSSSRPLAPGPIKETCRCSDPNCQVFGTRRRKIMRDGLAHVSLCICSRCKASRIVKNAKRRERTIERNTGLQRSPGSGQISGFDFHGACFEEETAQKSVTRGIRRWWESVTVQRKIQRLMSLPRIAPKALILSWDGRPQLVAMPYEDYRELEQLARARS